LFRIVLALFFVLSLRAEEGYELGKGVQVASLPLYIGGYFSLDYQYMEEQERYRLDDLALLAYGSYEDFSYMAELEYKNFYVQTKTQQNQSIEKDTNLRIERVYIDYDYDENYLFRVGKYNSPIGFWNLLPINVLRQTSSRPVSTNILFPKFTSGLGAFYTAYGEGEIHIDLIAQDNEDLDNAYNNYKINKHYGLNILYEKNEYALKANAGYFHKIYTLNEPDTLYYYLISAKYETEKYQFLAEIGSQYSEEKTTTPYAGYAQGLYRFTEQHIGSIRVESYKDKLLDESDEMAIFAYTYRPIYPIALKTEYQFHSRSSQNQFLCSFSVLF
jgi:hypothetical protein